MLGTMWVCPGKALKVGSYVAAWLKKRWYPDALRIDIDGECAFGARWAGILKAILARIVFEPVNNKAIGLNG